MEFTPRTAAASVEELAAIASVLGASDGADSQRVWRRGESQRTLLLPALNALKDRVGWISQAAVEELSEQMLVPRADIYGVATFYELLPTTEQPKTAVHVCTSMACRFRGGVELLEEVEEGLGGSSPERDNPDGAKAHESPCLGLCEFAPTAFVEVSGSEPNRFALLNTTAEDVVAAAQSSEPISQSQPSQPVAPKMFAHGEPKLLKRMLSQPQTTLSAYRQSGGYEALKSALEHGTDWVLGELEASGLRGRGGAAFPSAIKWRAVAAAQGKPSYIVANADESEPGTFKDRLLLEHDPFALIEAMTIAAYTVGAAHGYIYIRSEYQSAWDILEAALAEAEAANLLGDNISLVSAAGATSQPFSFHLELRRGAGAYICGEETALFNSIEGYRGEPRNKPPFPTDSGLFGSPTLVNNVETFANIPLIIQHGAAAFRELGSEQSGGTRLFCVSGDCAAPGVYEVPLGTTLRELLDLSQVTDSDNPLVLLGGAAGSFVGPDQLDVPLTFEDTAAAGLTLGSGAVIVVPRSADLSDLLASIAQFFVDESCGQCVPCRVGTVRQHESLSRLASGADHELQVLADLDAVMTDASICGLGQTAASAVRSAIKLGLHVRS